MKRPIQAGIHVGEREPEDSEEARLRNALREAASHWASGVAAVAVRDGEALEAITVTSFLTVSLTPPLILVSLNAHAAIVSLLERTRGFTVNLLARDQQRAANLIADRVPTLRTLFTADADPVLKDAVQTLVCRTHEVHAAGDHRLYLGLVVNVLPGRDAPPLLYWRRGYRGIAER